MASDRGGSQRRRFTPLRMTSACREPATHGILHTPGGYLSSHTPAAPHLGRPGTFGFARGPPIGSVDREQKPRPASASGTSLCPSRNLWCVQFPCPRGPGPLGSSLRATQGGASPTPRWLFIRAHPRAQLALSSFLFPPHQLTRQQFDLTLDLWSSILSTLSTKKASSFFIPIL